MAPMARSACMLVILVVLSGAEASQLTGCAALVYTLFVAPRPCSVRRPYVREPNEVLSRPPVSGMGGSQLCGLIPDASP